MIYLEVLHSTWYMDEPAAFQDWLAEKFVEEVQQAIITERFKGAWKALSPSYKKYKEENGLSPKMWEATGELWSNLYVKSHRVVGFDGRKRHSGSGKKYIDLARELEYGSRRVPARPLFRKVLFDMKNNFDKYKQQYLEEEIDNEL